MADSPLPVNKKYPIFHDRNLKCWFHQFLEYSADRYENKTALIAGSKHLTYGELNETADRLARFLVSIGVKRQDRVVICLENTNEAVVFHFWGT